MKKEPRETLEVAILPLEDGRRVVVPLQALVEVKQFKQAAQGEQPAGSLQWRGQDIPVDSLDAFCGLAEPGQEHWSTLVVFKAHKESAHPFRALACCGSATHRRVDALSLETQDLPGRGHFVGATKIEDELCLIPDLPKLLFADC